MSWASDILRALESGPMTNAQLQQATGIRAKNVSSACNYLIRNGRIRRVDSQKPGRGYPATYAATGKPPPEKSIAKLRAENADLRAKLAALTPSPCPGDVGTDHHVDMANVGEALMEAIRDYSGHAFMQHWHPADCPSEIVGDLLNALDEADGWRSVAGLPMWWSGIVTDGERVAFAQKAEADFDGYYWAVDPEDALEWEPTHCIAAPGSTRAALPSHQGAE